MWAGVRLVNGYSPIRPSGVSREFGFAIHGEIAPWAVDFLLGYESGPNGKLARVGVDGIIVASEIGTNPQPDTEWELAMTTKEGRVFHRRGGPFAAVRSVTSLNLQWGAFLATGETTPMRSILAALGAGDNAQLSQSVRWSLAQNAVQHPRVLAICRDELSRQPNEIRETLRAVIHDSEARRQPST